MGCSSSAAATEGEHREGEDMKSISSVACHTWKFSDWAKNKPGILEDSELVSFVSALKDRAFSDGASHSGWIEFQLSAIRSQKYTASKQYMTEEDFREVAAQLSEMTLFSQNPENAQDVCIVGSGAFGVAMAVVLGRASHRVRLLITSSSKTRKELEELAKVINETRIYPLRKIAAQLPEDYHFPENVRAFADPKAALDGVSFVVSAIPVQGTYKGMLELKDCIPFGVPIITVSKGICSNKYAGRSSEEAAGMIARGEVTEAELPRDPTYMMTMDEAINLALGADRNPIAALAGPSFAMQVCQGEPTAVTIACLDERVGREVALLFSTPLFKCYYTTDIVGAELSGALKNVVAIACGMCIGCPHFNVPSEAAKKLEAVKAKILGLDGISPEKAQELAALVSVSDVIDVSMQKEYQAKKGGAGLGLGPNATNFLLTRAWEDVRKICVKKGARSETLLSLSGLGDLMLTCFGGESRNAKFGGMLGAAAVIGTPEDQASEANPTVKFVLGNPDTYPVCEGYWTSKALKDMAQDLKIDLPVLSKMCDVLSGELDPRDLISIIMTEPVGPEFDPNYIASQRVIPARVMSEPPSVVQRRMDLLKRIGKGSALPALSTEPSSIALVMVEFQNEFTTNGGGMHNAVKETMAATGMLAKAAEVCTAARAKGCSVIHAPIAFAADSADNPNKDLGILKACCDNGLFVAGSWNAQICDAMKPQAGDFILQGKKGLDSFPNTNMEELLVECGAQTVVLGGFLTSCCVESTMRSAYEKGFKVITLTDCTADTSTSAYSAAVDGTFKLFSQPMSAKEFISKHLS